MSFKNSHTIWAAIKINAHNYISGAVGDFPCVITDANIPTALFRVMQSDGADLRITSDVEGTNELYYDDVRLDPSNEDAYIFVSVPSLSASDATIIYIWAGDENATSHSAAWKQNTYASDWVGVWPFEEGSGTDVYDRTAEGNDGTLENVSWTSGEHTGEYALEFDKSLSPVVRFGDVLGGLSQVTLMTRLQFATFTDDHDIFICGRHLAGEPLLVWRDEAGTDHYAFIVTDEADDTSGVNYSDVDADDTNWLTFAFVFDGNNEARIYVDGVEDTSSPWSMTGVDEIASEKFFRIGNSWSEDTAKALDGLINSASAYNGVLSADELALHHAMLSDQSNFVTALPTRTIVRYRSAPIVSPTGASGHVLDLANSLSRDCVGFWDMQGGKGSNVVRDLSPNGNDGTLENMDADADWVPGRLPGEWAVEFSDETSHVIDCGSDSSLNVGNSFTIMVLARLDPGCGTSGWKRFAERRTWGDNEGWLFFTYDDGRLEMYLNSTTHLESAAGMIDDGRWHQMVGVYDGANGLLYLDATLVDGPEACSFTDDTDQVLSFGSGGECRIALAGYWKRPLTPEEITQLYREPYSPIKLSTMVSMWREQLRRTGQILSGGSLHTGTLGTGGNL